MQHRSWWSHPGDTWGLLGGARAPVRAPSRPPPEAWEEARCPHGYRVTGSTWTTTAAGPTSPCSPSRLARPDHRAEPGERRSPGSAWTSCRKLTLHPGFAASLADGDGAAGRSGGSAKRAHRAAGQRAFGRWARSVMSRRWWVPRGRPGGPAERGAAVRPVAWSRCGPMVGPNPADLVEDPPPRRPARPARGGGEVECVVAEAARRSSLYMGSSRRSCSVRVRCSRSSRSCKTSRRWQRTPEPTRSSGLPVASFGFGQRSDTARPGGHLGDDRGGVGDRELRVAQPAAVAAVVLADSAAAGSAG